MKRRLKRMVVLCTAVIFALGLAPFGTLAADNAMDASAATQV